MRVPLFIEELERFVITILDILESSRIWSIFIHYIVFEQDFQETQLGYSNFPFLGEFAERVSQALCGYFFPFVPNALSLAFGLCDWADAYLLGESFCSKSFSLRVSFWVFLKIPLYVSYWVLFNWVLVHIHIHIRFQISISLT